MGGKNSYDSTKKYQDKVYERVSVVLRKGERDIVKAFAATQNKSLNAFIVEAIKEKIERESNNGKSEMPEQEM